MSPYIFSADLASVSETVKAIRAGLLVAQVDTSWEEATGSEGAELVLRAVIADRDGDHSTLAAILDRAAELDDEQPFGHRIVDEITAVISYPAAA
ncbi:hypothetical protein ACFXAW_07010 [Streptomyces sp. NPDC059445]|uniref:hypothetical protein n=1 Tax=Streptomyces sp. NPDC059445 TaxID=3346832 RepID=UPI00368F0BC7